MSGRLIAIGDIHGCLDALLALLETIRPQPDDRIVALGDYIDRGPNSRGVLDALIRLAGRCQLVPLLGNHEEMMLAIRAGAFWMLDDWLSFGGAQTVASYGCETPAHIPQEHIDFLRSCRSYYDPPENFFFVHASYLPDVPLDQQPTEVLRWNSIRYSPPGPHFSGKTAIVGHTSQKDGRILDLGYLKCIDTCCYGGQWLTALEVATGQAWQADAHGSMREATTARGQITKDK